MAIMSPCTISATDSHAGHADISLMTSQQDKIVVTGIVTDSNGEPLIGVNVLEKGTANGVITGLDGDFTLSVSGSESVLVFSYIGYKEVTVRVGSETSFSISMSEDTQQIDEVVVTALGIKREKKMLGYAVQDIKGEKLNATGDPSVTSMLSGKVVVPPHVLGNAVDNLHHPPHFSLGPPQVPGTWMFPVRGGKPNHFWLLHGVTLPSPPLGVG